MNLKIITAPTIEPLTLTEAKAHLRVTSTADDTLITTLIKVARQQCENFTGRALASATFELIMDSFPNGNIELPMTPVESVTSIKYKDSDNVETTWSSAEYIFYNSEPAVINLAYNKSYPTFTPYPIGAVKIRFVAGYKLSGTDASLIIPEVIKQALLLQISTLYENRENIIIGQTVAEMTFGTKSLLYPYKIFSF